MVETFGAPRECGALGQLPLLPPPLSVALTSCCAYIHVQYMYCTYIQCTCIYMHIHVYMYVYTCTCTCTCTLVITL